MRASQLRWTSKSVDLLFIVQYTVRSEVRFLILRGVLGWPEEDFQGGRYHGGLDEGWVGGHCAYVSVD